MRRQAQGNQQGERRTDQPGQVGGQRRAAVAEAGLEIGGHGAGRLAVGQAQQREAKQDEDGSARYRRPASAAERSH